MSFRRSVAPDPHFENLQDVALLPTRQTRVVLQLALGYPTDALAPAEWEDAFSTSLRERLVALAWQRQREAIKRLAPAPLVRRWRMAAMKVGAQGTTRLSVLVDAMQRLERARLSPVVLKGPPLAMQLYGDPSVRPISDLDLVIPAGERTEAFDVLQEAGWTWITGEAPGEESFRLSRNGETHRLEVHSTVIDDPLLEYVSLPIECKRVAIGDVTISAMAGSFLAASQAAHMAKHHSVPLLWVIDFCQLMQGMTASEWDRAREAATRCGLQRHLRRAEVLGRLACESASRVGDDAALARLCAELRPVSEIQRGLRLLRLSANKADSLRVVAGRLWPRHRRNGWRRLPVDIALRASTRIYRSLAATDAGVPKRHDADLSDVGAETVSSVIDACCSFSFRQSDDSMRPTIPPSATVRVLRAADVCFTKGQVVLVRAGDGRAALRRVVNCYSEAVVVSADLLNRRSWTLPVNSILGSAASATAYGMTWNLTRRAYNITPLLWAFLRVRWALLTSKLRQARIAHV